MDKVLNHVVTSRVPIGVAFLILQKRVARSVEITVKTLVDERV